MYTVLPLLVEVRVVEYLCGDAGPIDGWVGVEGSDYDLHLRLHRFHFLWVITQERHCSNTLTCTGGKGLNMNVCAEGKGLT